MIRVSTAVMVVGVVVRAVAGRILRSLRLADRLFMLESKERAAEGYRVCKL